MRNDWRPALLILLISFSFYALASAYYGLPEPTVHDEFSYLLAADTFLNGRLSNIPHEFWKHFESFHIIQQPTYVSKYPPGQGLALALGRLLGGHPIIGVWLSGAFACLSIYWMLLSLFPVRWAFFGSILAMLHPLLLQWNFNYWGGNLAAIGGALVMGATIRICFKSVALRDGVFWGVGSLLLANTRPYEGFILCLVTILVILGCFFQKSSFKLMRNVVLPIILISFVNLSWLFIYNFKTTGKLLEFPYARHHREYFDSPLFTFQNFTDDKARRVNVLTVTHDYWDDLVRRQEETIVSSKLSAFLGYLFSYFATTLRPPLWYFGFGLCGVFLVCFKNNRKWQLILFVLLILAAGLMLPVWQQSHYAAPGFGIVIALVTHGFRWIWYFPYKRDLVRLSVIIASLCGALIFLQTNIFSAPKKSSGMTRKQIEEKSLSLSARSLILVASQSVLPGDVQSYRRDYRYYVYNSADINAQTVVWAYELTREDNVALINYFNDRDVWLLKDNKGVAEMTLIQKMKTQSD